MSISLLFGDYLFPQIEAALGDALGDVLLGAGGAAMGALVYEILAGARDER